MESQPITADQTSPCQACGALLFYSSEMAIRFTTEDDAALDLIPQKFVNDRTSGMRCDGERCSALTGKIGVTTSCAIYAVRPEVCRTCMPGDAECAMARRRHGLPALVLIRRSREREPSPRPINLAPWQSAFETIKFGGYGSLLSQGRHKSRDDVRVVFSLRRYGLRQIFVVEFVLDR